MSESPPCKSGKCKMCGGKYLFWEDEEDPNFCPWCALKTKSIYRGKQK